MHAFRIDPARDYSDRRDPDRQHGAGTSNPRDLDLSADGKTLYVANTLGHTIAVINVANDANTLVQELPLAALRPTSRSPGNGALSAARTRTPTLNEPETGHGLPTLDANGVAIKNDGRRSVIIPVMSDATKATTFDDIGSELMSSTRQPINLSIVMSTWVAISPSSSFPGDVVDLA